MAEAEVQSWVKNKLVTHFGDRLYLFKCPQGPYSSRRGIPDLIMSVDGLFTGIEVKTVSGKLTKLQEFEIRKIKSAGGLAFVIYGKDTKKMQTIIEEIENVLQSRGSR